MLRAFAVCAMLCAVAGCSPATPPPSPTSAPIHTPISARPSPSALPAASPSPTTETPAVSPSASPTPSGGAACLGAGGRLESAELHDARLTAPLDVTIYLPACYDQVPARAYPVLYMLHGLAEDNHEWVNLGLTGSADRLTHAGVIPPLIIVMPRERTGLDMETAVVDVLVPYVDGHYRTLTDRADRAIGGLSRGAGWAWHIAVQHLDLFGAIGLHSPAVFGVDMAMTPRWVQRQAPDPAPRIWIDIGNHDPLLPTTEQLTGLLDGIPLAYTFTLGSGWHDADYWSSNVGTYLRWYGAGWPEAD